jgi:heterotetrameric sarcosine oxidase gamma subunit
MPGAKPETKLDDALAAAVRSRKMVLRECSSGLAVFRLTGPGAPWLLNKLSGLDFQAGIAHGPHCARTRMVHAAVAVHYLGASPDGPAFNLIFDRSIARHLWELLTASAPHADELARSYGADTTD